MVDTTDLLSTQRSLDNLLWTHAEQMVANYGASAVKRIRVMRRATSIVGDRPAAVRWDALAWRVDHLVAGNPR